MQMIEDDLPIKDNGDTPTPGSDAPVNTGRRWLDISANKVFVAVAIIVVIAIAANYL